MLVITRVKDDRITVEHAGERIEIVVTQVRSGRVWLGFDGPKSFAVVRDDAIKLTRQGEANATTDENRN